MQIELVSCISFARSFIFFQAIAILGKVEFFKVFVMKVFSLLKVMEIFASIPRCNTVKETFSLHNKTDSPIARFDHID